MTQLDGVEETIRVLKNARRENNFDAIFIGKYDSHAITQKSERESHERRLLLRRSVYFTPFVSTFIPIRLLS